MADQNIFGPDPAKGATTTRAARTIADQIAEYWFKICSGPLDPEQTIIAADMLNDILGALRKQVKSSGITPLSGAAGDALAAEALARYASGGVFATATGAQDAITLSPVGDFVHPKAYFEGLTVAWYAHVDSEGACNARIGALSQKPIKDHLGGALVRRELLTGNLVEMRYSVASDCWKLSPWGYNREIDEATVIVVNPAGGGDFLTLAAALDSLRPRRISPAGSVTVQLVDATHVVTGDYVFGHPDGAQITIEGPASTAIATTDLTVSGAYVTGDRTTNRTLLSDRIPATVQMASGGGSLTFTSDINIKDVLFDANSKDRGLLLSGGNVTFAGEVGVMRALVAGITINNASVSGAGNVWAVDCQDGVLVGAGGDLSVTGKIATCSNSRYGLSAVRGARVAANSTHRLSGNGNHGLNANGSQVSLGTLGSGSNEARYNGAVGYFNDGGYVILLGTLVHANSNTSHGIASENDGTVRVQNPTVTSNGGWGLRAITSGKIYCESGGTVNGSNTSGPAQVLSGGYIGVNALGTWAGTPSPAVNTVGNNNSYIYR
jgi:hypothetical protein